MTPTPTPSIQRNLNITSGSTYVINNGEFVCSNVARLISCNTSDVFYVNLPLLFNGNPLNVGDVFSAQINNETYCLLLTNELSGSSSHIITTINSIHVDCEDCLS
jgi:hypothetical protein